MTRVITRPMIGSPIGAPRATTTALAITPSETKPSTRAWLPSAIECRAVEAAAAAEPHPGGELVAEEADHSGGREYPEVGQLSGWISRWIVS